VIGKDGVEEAYSAGGDEEQRDRGTMHVPDLSVSDSGANFRGSRYGVLQERRLLREALACAA
jgi:hypothetical protein